MADNLNAFGASLNKALKDDGDDFLNVALRKWKFSSKYVRNQRLFIGLSTLETSLYSNCAYNYFSFSDILFDFRFHIPGILPAHYLSG